MYSELMGEEPEEKLRMQGPVDLEVVFLNGSCMDLAMDRDTD